MKAKAKVTGLLQERLELPTPKILTSATREKLNSLQGLPKKVRAAFLRSMM